MILDVVYNHLGPDGNYLRAFSPAYFTDRYENEWGEAINFDGADAGPVREFFVANAGYWIDEFHLDGLRLDATQQIFDASPRAHPRRDRPRARAAAARAAPIVLVAENEPQDTRLVRPSTEGGFGLDALWNDDFHHSAMVALTGRAEAYYSDYRGDAAGVHLGGQVRLSVSGAALPLAEQARAARRRCELPPSAFVAFLAEPRSGRELGARAARCTQLTSPGRWRAMTALLLLVPGTPMLFQGQEFAASAPFLYFADLEPELAAAVRKGRAEFLTQFPSVARLRTAAATLDDPGDPRDVRALQARFRASATRTPTPTRCTAICCGCAARTPAFRRQRRGGVDGAVLSAVGVRAALLHATTTPTIALLVVNLGGDLDRDVVRRAAARAAGRLRLGGAVVERGPGVRRRRHARTSGRTAAGACPANARSCWRRARARRDGRPRQSAPHRVRHRCHA